MNLIAIHQPNFAPWPGFWVKYLRSDRFVILDSAQMSWGGVINRVKMDLTGSNKWLTVATLRKYNSKINEVVIANKNYKNILFQKMRESYGNHEYFDLIHSIIPSHEVFLFDLNMKIFENIIEILSLPEKEIILFSKLNVKGHKNELLVNVMKEIGETKYLSGDGAKAYLDEKIFQTNNIEVRFLNYTPTEYLNEQIQVKTGLSILDLIIKFGPNKTKDYLMKELVNS